MIRIDEIIKITNAKVIFADEKDLNTDITKFSTDTRTISKGDFYLPLKGANFDGENFIDKAIESGAVGYFTTTGKIEKGAKFALYRTPVATDTLPTVTIPNSSIQGYLLEKDITTDDNGIAKFDKYEANGTKYTYYLVETKAPSGYNLMTTNKNISFVDSDVDAEGYITVEVPNESGFQLPTTGGSGTVIFTVIGIVLMAGAVIVLAVSRKKARK